MVSLATAGRRFDSLMYRDDGFPFRGTIEPADEGELPAYNFSIPRLILRTDPTCKVTTGDMIFDAANRRYLLADHDVSFAYNQLEHKTHRLFRMTDLLSYEIETTTTDPLTNLQKSTGRTTVMEFWALVERVEREFADTTLRVKEEVRRVISNVELQLGGIVNGMVVKRTDKVLGVYLAEVQ